MWMLVVIMWAAGTPPVYPLLPTLQACERAANSIRVGADKMQHTFFVQCVEVGK